MSHQITTNDIFGSVIMLDLSSPEVNRGSYCYLSYLLFSALTGTIPVPIYEVVLHEEFRISQLEDIEEDLFHANYVLVALWSYPQIETALMLNRLLEGKCYFYGYYPLIKSLGLNTIRYTEEHLLEGMRKYPKLVSQKRFKYDLLSDCDKHIKDPNDTHNVQMVPMFTSYGCPMGCKFCSATVNQSKRLVLPTEVVIANLAILRDHGKTSVHFTDEDFFFNPKRAAQILLAAYGIDKHFQFIALGGMNNVDKFCDYVDTLSQDDRDKIWHVLRLIEIGLETVDPALASAMGKVGRSGAENAIRVHSKCKCPILWLAVTFFPGETISSLNATGSFMSQYGFNPKQMEQRIITNGTEGGLGQFFQYYDGAGFTEQELNQSGKVLSNRPMRLIPSFIPYSFLNSAFKMDAHTLSEDRYVELMFWLSMYGISDLPPKIDSMIKDQKEFYGVVCHMLSDCETHLDYANGCIALAVMARLGILQAM